VFGQFSDTHFGGDHRTTGRWPQPLACNGNGLLPASDLHLHSRTFIGLPDSAPRLSPGSTMPCSAGACGASAIEDGVVDPYVLLLTAMMKDFQQGARSASGRPTACSGLPCPVGRVGKARQNACYAILPPPPSSLLRAIFPANVGLLDGGWNRLGNTSVTATSSCISVETRKALSTLIFAATAPP